MWNFIKRHKGKILLGGVVVGGAYAVQSYLTQTYRAQLEAPMRSRLSAIFGTTSTPDVNPDSAISVVDQESEARQLMLQSRKHYIFDSNQRTCDNGIVQMLPTLKAKLLSRFNVEELAEKLKNSSDSLNKVEVWNDMKVLCVARLVATAYTASLVSVALKTQVNILAARIYRALESRHLRTTRGSNGVVQSQQVFLQILQYFTTSGFFALCDMVEQCARSVLSNVQLNDCVNAAKFEELMRLVMIRFESALGDRACQFVIPVEPASFDIDHPELEELLLELKFFMDSENCRALLGWLLGQWAAVVSRLVREAKPEVKSGVPLARLIPVLTNVFPALFAELGGPQDRILSGDPLRQFAKYVFESSTEGPETGARGLCL